ncbi:hypothetical protein GCM10009616_06510 [Microlunatus lacustris]
MHEDDETFRVAETTPKIRYLSRTQSGALGYAAVPGRQYAVLNMPDCDAGRDRSRRREQWTPEELDPERTSCALVVRTRAAELVRAAGPDGRQGTSCRGDDER